MAKVFTTWKNSVLGKTIDLDNQSYDCVDVSKSWSEFVTGLPWKTSFCWGNAKDLWNNAPDKYWERSQTPRVGSIVCMGAGIGGGYGHTGVVYSVVGNTIYILQQNTFTQQAVYTGAFDAHASYIQGYLHPRVPFTVDVAVELQKFQRTLGGDVVMYRQGASRSSALMITDAIKDGKLTPGDTYDFKGFVRGEAVDGNAIWFVGMYSGGYAWSGGFTDTGTHDLADLTPAPTLAANQRQIDTDPMNYRKTPLVAPENVIRLISAGETLTMRGFVHGMNIDGNDIWYVHENGYLWSGGFKDKGTHDLPDLTPKSVPPTTPTTPTTPTSPAYTFKAELGCVTEVIPAGEGSFEIGNFPAKPLAVVLHDMGTDGKDDLNSTVNWFKRKDGTSAHFCVQGKRVVQMVSLFNRAYHAGPNGNMYVGIEIWPGVDTDPETQETVRMLLKQLDLFFGYRLDRKEHNEIMPTACGDDINIEQLDYSDTTPIPGDISALPRIEGKIDEVLELLKKHFK